MGQLFDVPEPPAHYLHRPEILDALKVQILHGSAATVGITNTAHKVGLQGMGGIGKSVLAAAVARDEEIRQRFTDGVIWLTLGRTPNLVTRQVQLAKALGDTVPQFTDSQDGRARLSVLLAQRACLIILDDVWDKSAITAFNRLGPASQLLITTRNAELLTGLGAERYSLDILPTLLARQLLSAWSGQSPLPPQAEAIIQKCGQLPLALAMVGAMLRDKSRDRWDGILQRLRRADLAKIGQDFPEYSYPNLLAALEVSVEALKFKFQERYIELAVFPEDISIPIMAVKTLWAITGEFKDDDTEDCLDMLENRSLLRRDSVKQMITLHDLQQDYIRVRAGNNLFNLHLKLLEGYSKQLLNSGDSSYLDHHFSCDYGLIDWAKLPKSEPYLWHYLAYHLREARCINQLHALLVNFSWLESKLKATDIHALIADYRVLSDNLALNLIRDALRLSTHILIHDKAQLASQLIGRLANKIDIAEIQRLLEQIKSNKVLVPWLRPLMANLTPPGSALLQTLEGHNDGVKTVAVIGHRRIISGSKDKTLKIWDLDSGVELQTLKGHDDWVMAVTVTSDNRQAVSASIDESLKVWDLAKGTELSTIKGYDSFMAVSVIGGDQQIIAVSTYQTVKVWNLDDGTECKTLRDDDREVKLVAITPDGRLAVFALSDNILKVWDFVSGKTWETDKINQDITALAVSMQDSFLQAVCAYQDGTIEIWDLNNARILFTLKGHNRIVNSLAVTNDGERVVSASDDRTLRVWDLGNRKELLTLTGHDRTINSVAVTSNDLAISASDDRTLKVWNLKPKDRQQVPKNYHGEVKAIAVTPDGQRAISASNDGTLKIWDLNSSIELFTLSEHTGGINSITVTPDSQRIISASQDQTLKVWDLITGERIFTLTGHMDWINSVAVSSDGRKAISASRDESFNIKIWDLDKGTSNLTITWPDKLIQEVKFISGNQRAIAMSQDGELSIWNLNDGTMSHTFGKDYGGINAIAVILDGQQLVTAYQDMTLRIWDLNSVTNSVTELYSFRGHCGGVIAVAPLPHKNGVIFASQDMALKIWYLSSKNASFGHKHCLDHSNRQESQLAKIDSDAKQGAGRNDDQGSLFTPGKHQDMIIGLAVTTNEQWLISASLDHTLRVWNLQNSKNIATFTADSPWVACAVSPTEPRIFAVDRSGIVHFIELVGI